MRYHDILTVAEAIKLSKIHERTMRRQLAKKRIPGRKLIKEWVVYRAEFERLLNQRKRWKTERSNYYSVTQCAKLLNCCNQSIYNIARTTDVAVRKRGKYLYIRRSDIDQLVKAKAERDAKKNQKTSRKTA